MTFEERIKAIDSGLEQLKAIAARSRVAAAARRECTAGVSDFLAAADRRAEVAAQLHIRDVKEMHSMLRKAIRQWVHEERAERLKQRPR